MKLLIIGGVAGGASAAARARRLDETAEIILFERGEYISFANCGLPYHVGDVIRKRESLLVMTPERFHARTRVDVRTSQEVTAIDPAGHAVTVRNLRTGTTYRETYDKLIIATGSSPFRPAIPGADDPDVMVLWTLADMDRIRERIDAGVQRAVVVGGGFLGLELAENLRHRGVETTLVELLPQVMPPLDPEMAAPLAAALRREGVSLLLNQAVAAIHRRRLDDEHLARELTVELKDGTQIEAGLVVLAIGVRPNSELARAAGLDIGHRDGIVVNGFLQTSHPDIYAVGDAVQVTDRVLAAPAQIPLAGPANRMGRLAADNLFGAGREYKGTLGASVLKLFQLTAACVGANEKSLQKAGTPFRKVYLNPFAHATYYPDAKQMHLKLLFSPEGRILGAQAVGEEGVDKRIDVIATAMQGRLTVFDLADLELAYAPPYGSAKDPVNFAGFIAANALRGETDPVSPDAVPADALVLDVREPAEVDLGAIPGALPVPLGKLRDRLGELPREREIVACCQVGLRGYLAERILRQHGFRARNLSGGYVTWKLFQAARSAGGPGVPSAGPRPAPASGAAPAPQPPVPAAAPAAPRAGASPAMAELDVCGLQCPGPIVAIKQRLDSMAPGELLRVTGSESSLLRDIPAFCESTGHPLLSIHQEGSQVQAVIGRGAPRTAAAPGAAPVAGAGGARRTTIVMFSNDLDRALAGLIIATGFASLGHEVTLFFTFWGLNILRKDRPPAVRKNLLSRALGWLMPRGARRLALSKMHYAGAGTAMMKHVMAQKHVPSLPDLIGQARHMGVKFLACEMAMNVMGITQAELLDGVETAGVANFAAAAEKSGTTLFV